MNVAILSEKGQITIPKRLRDKLGLLPGAVLEFDAVNGKLVGSKKMKEDLFQKWRGRGRLPNAMPVEKYLERARDAHGRR
jgi:antitoxin PrlF